MALDPLSSFLKGKMTPVKYEISSQPVQPPQPAIGLLDMLNPINWLKNQLKTNPEYQQVLDLIDQNGGDAKAAFYNECQKRGKDPDAIIKQVKDSPMFKQFLK